MLLFIIIIIIIIVSLVCVYMYIIEHKLKLQGTSSVVCGHMKTHNIVVVALFRI